MKKVSDLPVLSDSAQSHKLLRTQMFDLKGSFIPEADSTVFSYPSTGFYKLNYEGLDESISIISNRYSVPISLLSDLQAKLDKQRSLSEELSNLHLGPRIPFFIPQSSSDDIGQRLELEILPLLAESFLNTDSEAHFKAVLQDKQQLSGRLSPSEGTGYDRFCMCNASNAIYGNFYPLAFNQHSQSSARKAVKVLINKSNAEISLSGPLEIASALTVCPRLLHHKESYSPILVMSGVDHADSRLITCLKSYGPHLELWALSNLLTAGVEQVSEQWTHGLTHYISIS